MVIHTVRYVKVLSEEFWCKKLGNAIMGVAIRGYSCVKTGKFVKYTVTKAARLLSAVNGERRRENPESYDNWKTLACYVRCRVTAVALGRYATVLSLSGAMLLKTAHARHVLVAVVDRTSLPLALQQ